MADIEVDSPIDRGADRLAYPARIVQHAFGAPMINVCDDVAPNQARQELVDGNGGVSGVDHDRLTNRVRDLTCAPNHLARVLRVTTDQFGAEADLDAGYDL